MPPLFSSSHHTASAHHRLETATRPTKLLGHGHVVQRRPPNAGKARGASRSSTPKASGVFVVRARELDTSNHHRPQSHMHHPNPRLPPLSEGEKRRLRTCKVSDFWTPGLFSTMLNSRAEERVCGRSVRIRGADPQRAVCKDTTRTRTYGHACRGRKNGGKSVARCACTARGGVEIPGTRAGTPSYAAHTQRRRCVCGNTSADTRRRFSAAAGERGLGVFATASAFGRPDAKSSQTGTTQRAAAGRSQAHLPAYEMPRCLRRISPASNVRARPHQPAGTLSHAAHAPAPPYSSYTVCAATQSPWRLRHTHPAHGLTRRASPTELSARGAGPSTPPTSDTDSTPTRDSAGAETLAAATAASPHPAALIYETAQPPNMRKSPQRRHAITSAASSYTPRRSSNRRVKANGAALGKSASSARTVHGLRSTRRTPPPATACRACNGAGGSVARGVCAATRRRPRRRRCAPDSASAGTNKRSGQNPGRSPAGSGFESQFCANTPASTFREPLLIETTLACRPPAIQSENLLNSLDVITSGCACGNIESAASWNSSPANATNTARDCRMRLRSQNSSKSAARASWLASVCVPRAQKRRQICRALCVRGSRREHSSTSSSIDHSDRGRRHALSRSTGSYG
ncbi:hypothetical protein C8R43DRAFT_1117859 [Mycena crocata]|nr:hypothetical protein C8R43DRAFT_1117859 [Mycena crocata]